MAQLLFPDIAGSTLQGFQQGQQMRANRLIGQAMQNPDDSQGYLAQAGAIDPRLAMGVQGQMQAQQAQQAQTQQAQQDMAAKKLRGAALYAEAAVNSGDPSRVAAAQATLAPYLKQLTGKDIGPLDDPNTKAAMDQVLAQTAYLDPNATKAPQPYTLSPGGQRYDGNNKLVASTPSAPKITPQGYQAVLGPDGTYHAEPIQIQGAPGATGGVPPRASAPGFQASATSPSGNAVTFDFPPGTPPEVIAAAKASAVANGDLSPGEQVGVPQGAPQAPQQAPQTLAQAVAAQKAGTGSDVIGQRAQQIAQLKARGVQMTPEDEQTYLTTGKMGSNFQGGSSATLFGDPTKTGADYLATIPQGNREIVQGLLNGTTKMPSGTTLKSPLWQSVLASVQHADPAWNEAAFNQYAQARRNFTTGTGGRQINTINTALQHMQKLTDVVTAMNNGDFTALNFLTNEGANAFSHGQLANFNAIISQVATEMAAVYKGGNAAPTDQEIQHFRQALSPSLGHAKQVEVLRDWTDLLTGKLNSLAEQYQDSMSPLSQPITIIKPEARQAFNNIEQLNAKLGGGSPAQVPVQPPVYAPGGGVQQPGQPVGTPAPGTVEQGFRFKGGDPSNQANWEPMQ